MGGEQGSEPIREPCAAAFVDFGSERIETGRNARPHFVIGAAEGTHRHLKAAVLVEEEKPRADPLRLGREEGGGQRFAGPGATENEAVPDGGFLRRVAGLVEVETVA